MNTYFVKYTLDDTSKSYSLVLILSVTLIGLSYLQERGLYKRLVLQKESAMN